MFVQLRDLRGIVGATWRYYLPRLFMKHRSFRDRGTFGTGRSSEPAPRTRSLRHRFNGSMTNIPTALFTAALPSLQHRPTGRTHHCQRLGLQEAKELKWGAGLSDRNSVNPKVSVAMSDVLRDQSAPGLEPVLVLC